MGGSARRSSSRPSPDCPRYYYSSPLSFSSFRPYFYSFFGYSFFASSFFGYSFFPYSFLPSFLAYLPSSFLG
jgi:hypothetical protein